MKATRAFLLTVLVAFAAPASAAPIEVGVFGFNLLEPTFPEFGEYFFVALFPLGHSAEADIVLPGLQINPMDLGVDLGSSATELSSFFDFDADGLLGPGESAQTFADFFVGSIPFAGLTFGTLTGFSAGLLTLPLDLSDPSSLPTTSIFYDPEVASVPEPGTLLLLGSGLALAAIRGRRRRS
jgi:hypothetical protein